jgi:hypothetical protein
MTVMKKILITLLALTLPLFGQGDNKGYFKIEKVLDVGIIAQEFSTKNPLQSTIDQDHAEMNRKRMEMGLPPIPYRPPQISSLANVGGGQYYTKKPTTKEVPFYTAGLKKYYIPNLRIRRDYKFEAIYENTGKKVQHDGVTYEVLIVKRYVDFKLPKN